MRKSGCLRKDKIMKQDMHGMDTHEMDIYETDLLGMDMREADIHEMDIHEMYMRRAVELAMQGRGYTSPNPMVGCVVVKDGRVISEGYHERYGEFHAERNALLRCTEDPAGADLYATLEPCCHYGKTPPCTDIIIEKKIGHVYVGSMDSNPLVGGKGIQILRDHGINVTTRILEEECRKMNEIFFHYISTKMPYVLSKYAMSLDGKIACESGDAKWVTGEAAREEVHLLRKYYSGIMVGIGTVLADDPMLNCRVEEGVDPVRIICDSSLRIPLDSKIVQTAKEIPTIVAAARAEDTDESSQDQCGSAFASGYLENTGKNVLRNPVESSAVSDEATKDKRTEAGAGMSMNEKEAALKEAGVEVIHTSKPGRVDLKELMQILGERGIDSILLEGGAKLNGEAYRAGIINKVQVYIAGKIIGGKGAPSPVGGVGALNMGEAIPLKDMEVRTIGEDICITGYPEYTL